MFSKTMLRFVAAGGVLAIVLVVLGLNYVPRIYASSSTKADTAAVTLPRANYSDELYPRAISSQLSLIGSDWIDRHPSNFYTNSDWIDRHPSNYYANSDWIERHPSSPSQ